MMESVHINIKQLVTIAFAYAVSTSAAQAIPLHQALAIAYKNNPSLEAERTQMKQIDEAMPQALSGWLPTTSASIERGKEDRKIGSASSDNITDTKGISITQPLFQGGKTLAQIKQAEHTISAGRYNLQQAEQTVLLDAVIAYMNIVHNREVFELNDNNVAVLTKHLEATKERFRLGEVTRTDVAQAEASLAQALSEKLSSQGALTSSYATYERIIGEAPSDVSMPENPVVIEANLQQLIELAYENNPQLNATQQNKYSAEKSVYIEKTSLFPEINLLGKKQKQRGTLFSSSDIETESISFQVSVPLYQSGAEYSRVRQAKQAARKVEFDLKEQRNRVQEETIRAYQDFQVSRASITSNKASISAFESALEGTQQEALAGARTTLDVLDAEQNLFAAKVNLVRSKRDEIVSAYTLLAQVGKLNAEELKLDVTHYDPKENYDNVKYQIIGF